MESVHCSRTPYERPPSFPGKLVGFSGLHCAGKKMYTLMPSAPTTRPKRTWGTVDSGTCFVRARPLEWSITGRVKCTFVRRFWWNWGAKFKYKPCCAKARLCANPMTLSMSYWTSFVRAGRSLQARHTVAGLSLLLSESEQLEGSGELSSASLCCSCERPSKIRAQSYER